MTYSFRVVKRNGFLGVYEVGFDDAGRAVSCGERPMLPIGMTRLDLIETVKKFTAALALPVVEVEEISNDEGP